MRTLWIESERFRGNTIYGSDQPPYGYGLEHCEDVNTHKVYTVILKGDKAFSYLEKEDGSLVF